MLISKLSLFLCACPSLAAKVVIKGGTSVTYNETTQSVTILRDHSILVEGDKIIQMGPSADFEIPSDATVIRGEGKIVVPGFIDTHRHLFQAAFKTIGSNITMSNYFAKLSPYIPNVINRMGPNDIYYGQMMGILESAQAGVTSIVDHSYGTFDEATSAASLRASIDAGARVFWCFGFHAIPNNFTLERQAAVFHKLATTTNWQETPVELGVSYDEFVDAPRAQVDLVIEAIQTHNVSLVTTHFLGGPWIGGNSPVALNQLNLLNSTVPFIFSHATALSPDDVNILRQHNHHIAIAPESEMHFGHGFPHSHKIMDHAALAIDASWAWSADLVSQARIWLQNVRLSKYQASLDEWEVPASSPMSVNQAFILATWGGARSLRRSDLGVLKVGAKADIVIFDGDAFNMLGWNDPVAAIILHSHPDNVQHVLIDGQFIKRDFKLQLPLNSSVRLEDVKREFLSSAARIQSQFLNDPHFLPTGEHKPGVPFKELVQVDALAGAGNGY
ncbi:5-methylthioadenosine/S-adenosylhomocysteine deaminase [Paramyrothecium foliicola]|nr:5-methylthioadenosine/S-adenosylhomocysteine deaminase [Paramyrothecium foliicola]